MGLIATQAHYKTAVMSKPKQSPLRVNIGFIVHESPGYSKTFEFSFPEIEIADDLSLFSFACTAKFTRTQQGLYAEIDASGITITECVRCLEPAELRLHNSFAELYTFTRPTEPGEMDLRVPEDGYLDLKQPLREYLLLDQPIAPLCRPDCAGLCSTCGANRNTEDCGHSTDSSGTA